MTKHAKRISESWVEMLDIFNELAVAARVLVVSQENHYCVDAEACDICALGRAVARMNEWVARD